ncbi:MAG: H-NS histone family protein [Rhodobacteraceae bacterium]|nr:H-NS histone family protein [Paracoccaceae bacterium]MCB1367624.1 H-NS histone family protein [Paracoccaceae bacterium]
MSIDVNNLSLDELTRLKKDVDKAIASFEARRMAEVRAALDAKAREMGFTLDQLTGGKPGKKAPAAAKYRDPANPSATWSGRGRRPGWFVAGLAAGKSPDDFLIG